jgi:hypothetical protein
MLIPSNQKFFYVIILPMAISQMREKKNPLGITGIVHHWNNYPIRIRHTHVLHCFRNQFKELKFDFLYTSREISIDEILAHLKV